MNGPVSFSDLTQKEDTRIRPPGDLQDVQVSAWCKRCGCELYAQSELARGLCTDCLYLQQKRLELLPAQSKRDRLRKQCHIRHQ